MTLRTLHEIGGWVVIASNGLVGLWALAAHRFEQVRHKLLWIATGAAQILLLLQVLLGVFLFAAQDIQVEQFHMFYGFVAMMAVGLIYSYRHQLHERLYLLYGGGGLFLMGLGLRAAFLQG